MLSLGTSLVVQWLRPCALDTGVPGLIPGSGTRSHMISKCELSLIQSLLPPKVMLLSRELSDQPQGTGVFTLQLD